jgi:hypothetical protein
MPYRRYIYKYAEEKHKQGGIKELPPIVYGHKALCDAFNFRSRNGSPESDRKQFQRLEKKYGLPVFRKNRRIYMLKEHIEAIRENYLFGITSLAWFFGLHRKTFRKWLRRYHKMPVERDIMRAFRPELEFWYAKLIFERQKKKKAQLLKHHAPGTLHALRILDLQSFTRLAHQRQLEQYQHLLSEKKILNSE